MKRCPICGEARRLGPDGICRWRAGCEHRALVAEARAADLERELQHILEPEPDRRFEWRSLEYPEEGWPVGSWQEQAWSAWIALPEQWPDDDEWR